ncbi:MAG: hypothetical protein JNL74_07710 [Fibrobacteres bacterium]|nr:hypothetical protein [Fibrobacterota bacterium]
MSDRNRILRMVAEGKITVEEADELLTAVIGGKGSESSSNGSSPPKSPAYFYVKVSGEDNVDIRIPIGLLRAGMKFTSLIPVHAAEHINRAMRENGMTFDIHSIKPEHVDELIRHLGDMEINVKAKNGDNVRVHCGE